MRLVYTILAAALVAACGGPTIPKQYPGGEPGSFAEMETQSDYQSVDRAEIVPPRKIIIPGNRREERGLYLNAELPAKEVSAGTPVVVQCSVRNTTRNPTGVSYPTAQRFDAIVFADANQRTPVFMWSDTQVFAQFYEERMMGPGVAIARTLEIPTISLADSEGEQSGDLTTPLTPGSYFLWIRHAGTPALSYGPLEFTVTE